MTILISRMNVENISEIQHMSRRYEKKSRDVRSFVMVSEVSKTEEAENN